MVMHRILTVVLIAVIVSAAAGAVTAQDFRGTILGRVTDPQGAAIPHATVLVTNEDTAVDGRGTSDQTASVQGNLTRNLARQTVKVGTSRESVCGLLPGTTRNGATIQRQELLRPYPEFGDITRNAFGIGKA